MSSYKSLKTERLVLKPTAIKDAEFILELLNTPKWIKYIGERNVNSIEDAKNYVQNKMLPQLKKLGYGNYTVIKKSDKIKIGTCGLYDREGIDGIDIGFAFLPKYENNGFAFEAANKLIKTAFEEFNISKINAITTKNNYRSQKLLLKLGLHFNKIVKLPNDNEKLLLYTLSK